PDGSAATTADNQTLTFYGIRNGLISGCGPTVTSPTATCQYPTNQVETNAANNGVYKTVEAAFNKRLSHNWSANLGGGYTWQRDFPLGYPGTPNSPGAFGPGVAHPYDYSFFSLKGTGTYLFPGGIFTSVSYRFQAGSNYARRLSVTAPASCACTFSAGYQGTSTTVTNTIAYVSDYNAFRNDNVSVLDIRVEKTVPVGPAKLRLFGDVYNITNQYAAETIT